MVGRKYKLLVPAVNEIMSQYDFNLTLRQIYYRLVAKLIIPNTLNEYKYLSKVLVRAREKGEVDWRRIEDRTRTTSGGDTGYDDIEDFIKTKVEDWRENWKYFGLSMWGDQETRIEIWVEKDALATLFEAVASGFNVKVCPSRGYPSFTYVANAVERLRDLEKPLKILYFGDYDPSGLDIERDLHERLFTYGLHKLEEFTVERIALKYDQISEYGLPPMPAKRSDVRFEKFLEQTGTDEAVELDALEPVDLQTIIREAIADNLDTDLWNERVGKSNTQKEELERKFKGLRIRFEDEDEER